MGSLFFLFAEVLTMKITSSASQSVLPVNDALAPAGMQPESGDVAFFSSALGQPEAVTASLSADGTGNLFNQLSSAFNNLESDKKSMDSALRKASRSTDPLVLNQVDSQLSNYYLESMMNAKIVSKTVQGLEKLTNMQ